MSIVDQFWLTSILDLVFSLYVYRRRLRAERH